MAISARNMAKVKQIMAQTSAAKQAAPFAGMYDHAPAAPAPAKAPAKATKAAHHHKGRHHHQS